MNNDIFFEFHFSGCDGLPNPLCLRNPVAVLEARKVSDVAPAIAQAEAAWRDGMIVAGFVSYESASAFETAAPHVSPPPFPLALFAVFREDEECATDSAGGSFHVGSWKPDTDMTFYEKAVAAIKEHIAAGDVYQVNYTYRCQAEFSGDPLAWFRQISRGRHGTYSAFLRLGRHSVLSFSPELFFELNGGHVTTKPMKGTAPRGWWPEKDRENYQKLATSEKDKAENLMILDLMRNDLGKIATVGTVNVPNLFEIHALPTVYQMTSTVTAQIDSRHGVAEIFKGLFPSGSITGTPKISAMNLIQKLEKSQRGIYCGAIGVMYPIKKAVFNVAIRTIMIDHEAGTATLGVGGGITWDSQPASEHEETLSKSRFVKEPWPDFDLLETLRLEDGGYFLLDRHLNRLARSASYFRFTLRMEAVRKRLLDAAGEHPEGIFRVRLTASREGAISIGLQPIVRADIGPKRVSICRKPIDTNSPFIYHKTTYRQNYQERKALFPEAFDVLLMNEAGRYTEFTIGNMVIEQEGVRITPPVSEGLLPGVFREELLETGQLIERPVAEEDLRAAEAIWLINSVRRWVPVTLSD